MNTPNPPKNPAAVARFWKVEAARILRAAAKNLEDGKDCFFLFDLNGNKVGELDTYNT